MDDKGILDISIEVENPATGDRRVVQTNSWVKQMAQMVLCHLSNANVGSVQDTSGSNQTITPSDSNPWQVVAGAGVINRGLVVGTGTTAVDKDDNDLQTVISNGTGTGNLSYGAQQITGPTAISGGYRVTLTRQVDNNSGAEITIEEIGIRVIHGSSQFFLILRDLLSEAIPDGESRLMKYHLDLLA